MVESVGASRDQFDKRALAELVFACGVSQKCCKIEEKCSRLKAIQGKSVLWLLVCRFVCSTTTMPIGSLRKVSHLLSVLTMI